MWDLGAINWASVVISAVLIGAMVSILVALMFRCRDNKISRESTALARGLVRSAGERAARGYTEHLYQFAPSLRDLNDHEARLINRITAEVEQIVHNNLVMILHYILVIVRGSHYLTVEEKKVVGLMKKGIGTLVPDYETPCVNGENYHYVLDDGVCVNCKESFRILSEDELKQWYESGSEAMTNWIYGKNNAEEKSEKEEC